MARTKKTRLAKPAKSDAEVRYRIRLIRWAELMRQYRKLEEQIERAAQDGAIQGDAAEEALQCLCEAGGHLTDSVPTD
jgi:hypothetical protein